MALFRAAFSTGLRRMSVGQQALRQFASDTKKDDGKFKTFGHPIEHATGDEKKVLMLEERGITDPYYLNALKRGPGTKDNPNIVPSFEPKRLIGCICEDDATCINWLWVHKGDPKRCECGYWFKCVDAVDHFTPLEDEIYPPPK